MNKKITEDLQPHSMKEKKTALELYRKFMETGVMNNEGLCIVLENTKYKDTLSLFEPSLEEQVDLGSEGSSSLYWGSEDYKTGYLTRFTPRRQTILLLIAAIHEEL